MSSLWNCGFCSKSVRSGICMDCVDEQEGYEEKLKGIIADLLGTLEEVESFGPKIPKEYRDMAKQAIEAANAPRS